jgi:hypothetical protein
VDWDPDVIPAAAADVGNEMWCISIARIMEYLGPGTEAFDIGLVVARVQKPARAWARAGIFRQLREGNALFPENVADSTELTIVQDRHCRRTSLIMELFGVTMLKPNGYNLQN